MKPNNTVLNVHKDSNHLPSIIQIIPESINKRLSTIPTNETICNQSVKPYQEALQKVDTATNYTLWSHNQTSWKQTQKWQTKQKRYNTVQPSLK